MSEHKRNLASQKKDTSLFQRGASSLKQRRVFFRYQNRVLLGIFDFESVFLKPKWFQVQL